MKRLLYIVKIVLSFALYLVLAYGLVRKGEKVDAIIFSQVYIVPLLVFTVCCEYGNDIVEFGFNFNMKMYCQFSLVAAILLLAMTMSILFDIHPMLPINLWAGSILVLVFGYQKSKEFPL